MTHWTVWLYRGNGWHQMLRLEYYPERGESIALTSTPDAPPDLPTDGEAA